MTTAIVERTGSGKSDIAKGLVEPSLTSDVRSKDHCGKQICRP